MNPTTKIILFGDICPTNDTLSLFESGNPIKLFNDVLNDLNQADYIIGNLEFVLSDSPKYVQKTGPILSASTKCIEVLKNANFKLLSLANNHIKDCGEQGVASTIETCRKVGIETTGAEANLDKAKEPYITEIKGLKIGVVAFAEQEFNCATSSEYGANYFDPYEDLDLIEQTKKHVDYLIILYHGGIEHYQYPSPILKKKCRKFIDKGADLVTCQHSHCVGVIDRYKNKTIVYGQGNSIFGYRKNDLSWNSGLLIELIWSDQSTSPELKLIPIEATVKGIQKMNHLVAVKFLEKLEKMSLSVEDDEFLEQEWIGFSMKKEKMYLPFLFAYNRFFIHLNRLTKNSLIRLFYSRSKLRTSHNIIRCEAHNEVIQTVLKQYY